MDQTTPPAATDLASPTTNSSRPAFRDPTTRARFAAGWIGVTGTILSIQLVEYIYLALRYGGGENLTFAASDAGLDTIDLGLALLVFVAFIGSAFTFLRWMARAYANVRSLGYLPRYGNGQAIWTWFVPVLNLWRPKQLANDVWRVGEPAAEVPYGGDLKDIDVPGWLMVWWLLAIVPAGGLTNDSLVSWILFAGTLAPASFLCMRFVRRATARQLARDSRLAQAGHPAAPSGS